MCFCYHGTSGVLAHYFHTAKKAASRMIPVHLVVGWWGLKTLVTDRLHCRIVILVSLPAKNIFKFLELNLCWRILWWKQETEMRKQDYHVRHY